MSVIVVIAPTAAHSSANFLDMGFARRDSEGSVSVVAIKLRTAEVVGHEKIRKSVGVGVAPGARKTVSVVVGVHPRCFCCLDKRAISFVMEQAVGWTVAGIE